MKVAFGTVVYPASLQFFSSFIDSINNQTVHDFDLFIINDFVNKEYLEQALSQYRFNYIVKNMETHLTAAEIRTFLLRTVKEAGYDLLILGDSDDCFSSYRVENTMNTAISDTESSFYYNKMLFWDNTPVMPPLPAYVDAYSYIKDYNFLGLTNTSIRLDNIELSFIETLGECKQTVYDWYLYSRLLLSGLKGLFVPEAASYYRSWAGSTIGRRVRNINSINNEVLVKLKHYSLLKKYSSNIESLYNAYRRSEYSYTQEADLYFWWNYTVANTS